ncbi:SRPBCC family protein [Streptomyces sp. NBC_00212]|uniref:SRPBCC family protein n=1 Tax=Streptomyces sp. NBC_00212 TaxID=2975684 RepID=UPI003244D502
MAETKNPLTQSPAVDRLKQELQGYLLAQGERLLMGMGHKLGETTVKLNDIAEGRSPGFAKLALEGGRKVAEGKGPVRAAVEMGASHLKDNAKELLKGLGGKRKKGGAGRRPTVIMESVDVGVPVREAYDQWTQFQSFATFAKGVKSATVADDTTSDWKVKVFWSSRSWKAHTTEQVPDARIAWTSEGAKGTAKGVVTFHPLGENITRVLLVMEYYPKGLFEKTGNIWRSQGRRARLDLKNFARHIALRGEAEGGWRGEIRDGEVVVSHEDAIAEEEEQREPEQQAGHQEDQAEDQDTGESEPEQEEEPEAEPDEEYEYEDEAEGEGDAEGEGEGGYEEDDAGYEDDADRAEEEEDPEEASSVRKRRAYAGSRSNGRR